MAKDKKEVKDVAAQAARMEEERRKAIAEFNVQNMGKILDRSREDTYK